MIEFGIPDDMEKNSHLKGLQELGPLTVLRADMDEEGSLDDAVASCDYAFLVAAPVNLWAQDPEVPKHHRLIVTTHHATSRRSLSHSRHSLSLSLYPILRQIISLCLVVVGLCSIAASFSLHQSGCFRKNSDF